MERVLVRRAYPLWKICAALLALLALLAASQSFFRLPGTHVAARAASAPATSGDPIYMNYDTVPGDVVAVGHEGWIQLNSFQFGVGRAIGSPTGSPADRAGAAPQVSEVVVTKVTDKASVGLLKESLAGTGKTVVIDFVKNDQLGRPSIYLKVTLTNTLISGFNLSSGGDLPTESISLNFTKIVVISNLGPSPVTVGWDLALAHLV